MSPLKNAIKSRLKSTLADSCSITYVPPICPTEHVSSFATCEHILAEDVLARVARPQYVLQVGVTRQNYSEG